MGRHRYAEFEYRENEEARPKEWLTMGFGRLTGGLTFLNLADRVCVQVLLVVWQ